MSNIKVYNDGTSMFDIGANILVNATNCQGIMGGGLAAAFKAKYPEMYADYKLVCDRGVVPGIIHAYMNMPTKELILNFPTKNLVANPSEMVYVAKGLAGLCAVLVGYRAMFLNNVRPLVAIPALGCGLGGLTWKDNVEPMVMRMLSHELLQDYDFAVFAPQ